MKKTHGKIASALRLLLCLSLFVPVQVRAEEADPGSEEVREVTESEESPSGEEESIPDEETEEEVTEGKTSEEEPAEEIPEPEVQEIEEPEAQETEASEAQDIDGEETGEPEYEECYVALDDYSRVLAVDPAICKEVENVLAEGFAAHEEYIDVSKFRIPFNQDIAGDYYYLARKHFPEYFYAGNRMRYATVDNETIAYIHPNYDADYTPEMSEAFFASADAILSGIDENWTEEEKALYLHDQLVLLNTYDNSLERHNAYHALVEHTSVCEGYAMAFYYLLREAGVTCEYVRSKTLNHEWNTVTLNGKVYFVDVTWDDPSTMYLNGCDHRNFLCSETQAVANKHTSTDWLNTYGEEVYGVYENPEYDNAYFKNSCTPVVCEGTGVYYMTRSVNNTNLYFHDYADGTDSVFAVLPDDRWSSGGSSSYTERYWGLGKAGKNLYVSSAGKIIKVDSEGKTTTVYSLTSAEASKGNIYGFRINGNQLTYRVNRTPYEASFALENTIELDEPVVETFDTAVNEDGSLTITKYNGTAKDVTVPSEIDGKKVTKLGDNCFSQNSGITSVVIPEGVTEIGDSAFEYCTNLHTAVLPSTLAVINGEAFCNCTALEDLTISKNIIGIGNDAFSGCSKLRTVGGTNSGANIKMDFPQEMNKNYLGLFAYAEEITVPEGVTAIGDEAFLNLRGLRTVTLPDTCTSIGASAFENCSGLETIVSPAITELGANAFSGCAALKEFPEFICEEIPAGAFSGCSSMVSIAFGKELKSIGANAFANCPESGLTITYDGTKEDWAKVSKAEGNGALDTAAITVITPVESVVITDKFPEMMLYDTIELRYEVHPDDAFDKSVTILSSNPEVVAVDPQENLLFGASLGTSTITVVSNYDETIRDSYDLEVVFGEVKSIEFKDDTVTVIEGKTEPLFYTVLPENHSDRNIRLYSDNPEIVSVDSDGNVTGRKRGRTTVTAEASNGIKDTVEVIVCPDGIWAEITNEPENGFVYTGEAIKPSVNVFDSGRPLIEKQDYSVSYKNNKNAGEAQIVVTLKGNYAKSGTQPFTIKPVDMNDPEICVEAITLVQSATPKTLTVKPKVTWNGKNLKEKTDYTIDYTHYGWNQKDIGPQEILLKGTGNFTGNKTVTVNVVETSKEIIPVTKLKVTAKAQTYTEDINIDKVLKNVTVADGKLPLTKGVDYTVSDDRNCDRAGTCTFVITGMGGKYQGQRTVSVKINGTALSKAKADPASVLYDGSPKTIKDANLKLILNKGKENEYVLEEDRDFIVTGYANNIKAGKATASLKGLKGFAGTSKVTFTIMPDTSGRTIEYNEVQNYVKGGVKPLVSIEGLTEGTDFKVTYKNNKNLYADEKYQTKNPPTITVKFLGNYKGTADIVKHFRILPADLAWIDAQASDVDWTNKNGNFIPKITLTDADGTKLSAGTDYSKSFRYLNMDAEEEELDPKTSKVSPGTRIRVEITESGKGNYVGTAMAYFRVIEKEKDISKGTFTIQPKEYTGSPIVPEKGDFTKAQLSSEPLVFGEDFEITDCTNNVKKGTAKVTLHGIGKYGGYRTVTFKINMRGADKHWIIIG